MSKEELKIETKADAARLQCPRGHQLSPTNNHWWCRACSRHWTDVEAEFDVAIDAKTGQEYHRDEVEMDFELPGVYLA